MLRNSIARFRMTEVNSGTLRGLSVVCILLQTTSISFSSEFMFSFFESALNLLSLMLGMKRSSPLHALKYSKFFGHKISGISKKNVAFVKNRKEFQTFSRTITNSTALVFTPLQFLSVFDCIFSTSILPR